MDRFELIVCHGKLDQRGLGLFTKIRFEIFQQLVDEERGWRHEPCPTQGWRSDYDQTVADLLGRGRSRIFAAHENLVHFAEQPAADRDFSAPRAPIVESGQIVCHHFVVTAGCGDASRFIQNEIGEGRVRALDLARKHGFAPQVVTEEQIGSLDLMRDPVESGERLVGL